MNPLLEKKLNRNFPDLIHNDLVIECLDGWYQIIHDMCYLIEQQEPHTVPVGYYSTNLDSSNDIEVEINQIKEKFGGLRVYYHGGNDIVAGIVKMAEKHSFSTCENCGNPAKCKSYGHLTKTICNNCRKFMQAKNLNKKKLKQ